MAAMGILGFLLLTYTVGVFGSCDEGTMLSCHEASGMGDFLDAQGWGVHPQHPYDERLYTLDKPYLKLYCRLFGKFKACLDTDVLSTCSSESEMYLIGANQALHFLCGESYKEYIEKHQKCFGSIVMEHFGDCGPHAQKNQNVSHFCKNMKESESCQIKYVDTKCGHKTGSWARKFIGKMNYPVLNYFRCDTDVSAEYPQQKSFKSKLISFGMAMLGLTLMCGLCVIMVKRKWNKSNGSTADRSAAGSTSDREDSGTDIEDDTEEHNVAGSDDILEQHVAVSDDMSEHVVVVSDKKKLVSV